MGVQVALRTICVVLLDRWSCVCCNVGQMDLCVQYVCTGGQMHIAFIENLFYGFIPLYKRRSFMLSIRSKVMFYRLAEDAYGFTPYIYEYSCFTDCYLIFSAVASVGIRGKILLIVTA